MAELTSRQIACMPWDEFLDRLDSSARGLKRESLGCRALREFFGEMEFQSLLQLNAEARAGRRRAGSDRPVVILLPGIMGSSLVALKRGVSEDLVWVDYLGLAAGRMAALRLTADGRRERDASLQVRTSTVDKRVYARIVVALGAQWDVQPFAFDWRKDLDLAADELAARIRTQYARRPVHLVAHSMGGLVGRNFMRRHKDLWESLRVDGEGGRFIMLGTPNYGSYDILRVLSGRQPLLRLLSALDVKHSLRELQEVLASFPGIYQVLPFQEKLDDGEAIYAAATWGSHPVSTRHLKRASEFHHALAEPGDADAARLLCIAGCNRETLRRVRIDAPGSFSYTTTFAGDGRVPCALALLSNVSSYFVDEAHGNLPRSMTVIRAVDQALNSGRTNLLASRPPVERADTGVQGAWRRAPLSFPAHRGMPQWSRNRRAPASAGVPESRCAEKLLLEAALAMKFEHRDDAHAAAPPAAPKTRLVIEVAHGDVTQARVPVVAVGHYQGVTPVNAIGAIDRRLDGWLTHAARNSMLGGELGRLFFFPTLGKLIAAAGVLVAGMGPEGRFSLADLRYLMQTVSSAVAAWKMSSFATVLIGAGEGNLPLDKALRAMAEGIREALERLPAGQRLKRIVLVEIDMARARWIRTLLEGMRGEFANRGIRLEVKSTTYAGGASARRPRVRCDPAPGPEPFGPRLTVTRQDETLRFTALTRHAVIPAREIEVQDFYLHGIAGKLMSAGSTEEQATLGRLLSTYLLPADLLEDCTGGAPLTVIVDRTTAAVPWEMAALPAHSAPGFLGTDLQLTRQFQTLLAPAPGLTPAAGDELRILVIADPAPDDLHLAGAAREGAELVRLFRRMADRFEVNVDVVDLIGPKECDPVEILALLLDEEFDIVHFAGHGVFDAARPNHGGWVFGRESNGRLRTLAATEIFRARRVPRLVFANACFSAAVGGNAAAFEKNRALAGLAEAFFERGVRNYIGAGWPVGDQPSVEFAREFYAQAIAGVPARELESRPGGQRRRTAPKALGESLAAARRLILGQGPTWGAYHHYGDAGARLIRNP